MFVTGCQQADTVNFSPRGSCFQRFFLCSPGLTPTPAPSCVTPLRTYFCCAAQDLISVLNRVLLKPHSFTPQRLLRVVRSCSPQRTSDTLSVRRGFAGGARARLAAGPKGCGFTVAFAGGFHRLPVGTEANVGCQRTPSSRKSW